MSWTHSTAKKASPLTLWCELGLHRGFIGSNTAIRRGNAKDSLEVTLSYYNLGEQDLLGICDSFYRFVLHKSTVSKEDWFDDWDQSNKVGELEGPVLCERVSVEASNNTQKQAHEVLRFLKEGPRKPVLKRTKPRLKINIKPKLGKPILKHKPNTKFRIKGED